MNLNNFKARSAKFFEKAKYSKDRVKSLLCMQMGDKLRRRTAKERRRFAFRIFLLVLAALVVTAAMTAVCILIQSMFYIPLDRNMLASVLLITQIFAVLADVGAIQRVFFTDKENALLLTLPCKFGEIVTSRLLLFILSSFKRNCFFLLPTMIGFGIATKQGVGYYLMIPLAYLVLSLIPIFVDCVLSLLLLYGKRFVYSKPLFCAISTVIVFALIFYGVNRAVTLLPNPLRLLQEYARYIASIAAYSVSIAKFSLHYGALADLMVGSGSFLDFLIVIGVTVAIILIGVCTVLPFYFAAVSSSSERSSADKKTESGKKSSRSSKKPRRRRKTLYATFLRKEILITLRDSQKLAATIASFFVLPTVSYFMNYALDAINTNPLGDYITIAFNLMISASLLAAFNTECAYALSAEGLEFAVLKTAPSNTASIVWGKITVSVISNFVAIAATSVMLYLTTGISLMDIMLFTLTLFLIAVGMVLWSFQLDVRRPQFAEYASKGTTGVVNNPNVSLAALIGFLIATIAGALTLLLLFDDYVTGWIRIVAIAFAFCAARVYLFACNLRVYFREIEL